MKKILKILLWIIIAAAGLILLLPVLLIVVFIIALWLNPGSPKPTTGELTKDDVTTIMDSFSGLEIGEYNLIYSISHYSSGIPTRIDNDFVISFEDDIIGSQVRNNPEWQPLTEAIDEAYPIAYIIQEASESGNIDLEISDNVFCYHKWTHENGSNIYLFYDQRNQTIYGRYHND